MKPVELRKREPEYNINEFQVENINTSLTFLAALGVSVDGVSAKDIKDGNLKSILGLFFSLSRYKQQQKTLLQQQKQQQLKQQQQQQQQRGQSSTSSSSVVDNNSNSSGKAIANGGETISR
ncbi:neuron navigator 2 [Plakobranchus ocellatus]|uniref:Neuron navigator 2 n=1 Tax=Plakobranchus ocellatus TaxID=259542 RepID=A0AAV4DZ18_9GAST|nr:neuron navigator 2 [Plakobranchus ocellatus]